MVDNGPSKRRKLDDGSFCALPEANSLAMLHFQIGEIVWAKIKGFPHWPCMIKSFDKRMILVEWFNDYRCTKVFKSQLFKFLPNFDSFSKGFSQRIGLETAAREALVACGQKMNANLLF